MAKAVSAPASQPDAATRPPARFAIRGHDAAASRVAQLLTGVPPHALLIVGPRGAGAGTLARDVAATLLCISPQSGGACGECRACRLVAAESHADLARISPSGAADEIGAHRRLARRAEARPHAEPHGERAEEPHSGELVDQGPGRRVGGW